MVIKNQVLDTLGSVMQFMSPYVGGTVPTAGSEEYTKWKLAIQVKYEEAARRGRWRRLLTKDDTITVNEGDESIIMPDQFTGANRLYIFALGGADGENLADPDRQMTPQSQTISLQQINDPDDPDFGLWEAIFKFPITESADIIIWYWATPPVPDGPNDKILLPGDMVAFGALQELFRASNLEGSQDSAQLEFENRLNNYLADEMIPPINELITFTSNPGRINRTIKARRQYQFGRNRVNRS